MFAAMAASSFRCSSREESYIWECRLNTKMQGSLCRALLQWLILALYWALTWRLYLQFCVSPSEVKSHAPGSVMIWWEGGKTPESTCAYFGFQTSAAVDRDAGPPLWWDRWLDGEGKTQLAFGITSVLEQSVWSTLFCLREIQVKMTVSTAD